MYKYIIQPYKMGSKSSKVLAEALGCRRIHVDRNTYQGYPNHIVINWGSRKVIQGTTNSHLILNDITSINNASNKIRSFELFKQYEVPTLEFTTDPREAQQWLGDSIVFARTLLTASGGKGIVVQHPNNDETIVQAPLYTKNFEKTREYRAHVVKGRVILIQQKRLKSSENRDGEPDEYLWNHDIGQRIFVRNNVELTTTLKSKIKLISIKAVEALGLDFGAVDIGYKDDGSIIVFEVNTACGLEGSTIEDYRKAFQEVLDGYNS